MKRWVGLLGLAAFPLGCSAGHPSRRSPAAPGHFCPAAVTTGDAAGRQ